MAALFPYIVTYILGAITGSFLNVCIYRLPRGISIVKPRSACPACSAQIKARELIPLVSYLFLRGRCSSCGAKIPVRYPLVEFLCGALWIAAFWKFALSFQFVFYALIISILLAVFFIDLEWMRIPNKLVLSALIPAAALSVRYAFFLSAPERFRSAYGGIDAAAPLLGLIPAAFFLLIYAVTSAFGKGRGSIGMGDIKLLIPAGLALGLRQCALAVFVAVMLGGATGVLLLATGRKTRKDPIPFGPFLTAGIIFAIFVPLSAIV